MSFSDYDLLLSDGEFAPKPALARPATRLCPRCGYTVPCYRPLESEYFGCLNCYQFFRVLPGAVTQAVHKFGPAGPAPALALGSVGTLGNYRVRITGCQRRSEKDDLTAQWLEYQLTPADAAAEAAAKANPGFPVQLAEYQGHWQLVRPVPGLAAKVPKKGDEWEDPQDGQRPYRLWHRYQPLVLEAQGEFDWNVLDDEHLHIVELTGAPYLLSGERRPGQAYTWYRSRYLEPAQVAAAFGVPTSQLPPRQGVGASQLPPDSATWAPLRHLTWVGIVLLLALQALLLSRTGALLLEEGFVLAPPPLLAADTLAAPALRARLAAARDTLTTYPTSDANYPTSDQERVEAIRSLATTHEAQLSQQLAALMARGTQPLLASRSFAVAAPAALRLSVEVPSLDNNWMELGLTLVNEQTGRTHEATRALERYSGYEGGESWSEGSTSDDVMFNAVPAGRYHVNLYPSTDPQHPATSAINLRAEPAYGLWGNFWLLLLGLSAPLAGLWLRRYRFEQARWQGSDYGPDG